MQMLEEEYFGIAGQDWLIAIGVGLALMVGLRLVIGWVASRASKWASKTETDADDLVVHVIKSTRTFFYLGAGIYASSRMLAVPEDWERLIRTGAVLVLLLQAAFWGTGAITFFVASHRRRREEEDPAAVTTIGAMGVIARIILWSVIVLLGLANLGIDITALVAGLGVGGVAVALAVQNVLGDLLASLSIVLDKPFVVGDFIIVGDLMGTVEHVGLKTTRLKSLSGEQLVFGNGDLLGARIRNYKRMEERRISFEFGVLYETPSTKLEQVPEMVREIVEGQEGTRFDRAHFKSFGASSIDYEVVYYMLDPDYTRYMDAQQAMNLALVRKFEEQGIGFAYPTQTLYVSMQKGQAA